MREGDWYLFAVPWDWTFVGQYVRHLTRDDILVRHAGYFTRTGATFDKLCLEGFNQNTQFHPLRAALLLPDGTRVEGGVSIPAQGPKFPWQAPTPWVEGERGGRRGRQQ